MYQYSISHIRISEKLIIFFAVVVAALLNISLTGLALFPIAALMFFSMWESNIIIASITVILLIIVCAETGDKKISKYLFPISIMILTGCSSDTGVYLTVAILFVCSLLWNRSLFTILTPLFLYSFNNLLEIMPMIMETAKSSNFVLIAISDIVIAFLLSIPISLFVGGYDK